MKTIGTYAAAVKASVQQQLTYVGELLLRNISLIIFMGIFVVLWNTAYTLGQRSELSGYRLEDIIWYLAMTESILMARSRSWMRLSQDVRSGDIAYNLARPYHYPLFEVASSLGDSVVRLVINIAIAGGVALLATGQVAGTPAGWAWFGLMALIGLVIDALVALLIGLAAFFMEEVEPVFWIYEKLLYTLGGLFLPLEVFPDAVRAIAEWLPLKAILYLPAHTFVKFDTSTALSGLLQQLIILGGVGLLVLVVWPFCVRRVTIHGG